MESNEKNLFFFETPSNVSKKVYNHLSLKEKYNILDIGAGNGSLLRPTVSNKIHKIAIEVNENLKNELLNVCDDVYIGDLLEYSIKDITQKNHEKSIYVSNPPFGRINATYDIQQLLFSQGLSLKAQPAKSCRIELVFMARVLEAASFGDEAAFIVPVSLLENADFKLVRETLVNKHNLHTCLILPEKAFKKTEVRTAILWLRPHNISTDGTMQVYKSNYDRFIMDFERFVERGILSIETEVNNSRTLSPLIINIKRGKSSKNSLLQRKIKHIHTSDLNRLHAQIIHGYNGLSPNVDAPFENVARDGDILIARVGTRVLGKTAIFSGKDTVISDCVVRLRVADSDRNLIFKQLASEKGQSWLKSVASGSCARVLTYDAINNFPITI